MVTIFKHHFPVWSVLEVIADCVLCFLAVSVAAAQIPGLRPDTGRHLFGLPHVLLWAALFSVSMALLYAFVGLYRKAVIRVRLRVLLGRGLVAMTMGSCIAYLALESLGDGSYAILLFINAVPAMAVAVVTVRSVGHLVRRGALGARRVLIVGTGPEARNVAADLAATAYVRHVLVGFYSIKAEAEGAPPAQDMMSVPVFDGNVSIDQLALTHRVDEIIVAVREQRGVGLPMDQLLACRTRGLPVLDLAAFFERAKGEVPIDSLKASWLVYGHGFVQGALRTFIKRQFDIVVSLLLLAIAFPIMVLAAIAIKFDSRGPILYLQQRVGLRGRLFNCPKFRSMSADAEQDGVARWAIPGDSRVTRVGAVIRKYRIDELPQLVSVLRGEMSLVGPRPERPAFVEQLRSEILFYDIRHSVKPGVTGWAQVRYSYGASVEDARRKHQFDLYYVKNHSLFLDLLVLVETVSVVLFREGSR